MSLGFVSVPDALAAGSVKVSPTKGITGERVKFTIKTKVCSGSTTYRVYAPAAKIGGKKVKAAATSARKVTTQAQSGTLKPPTSAYKSKQFETTATFKPARKGRAVKLQAETKGRGSVRLTVGGIWHCGQSYTVPAIDPFLEGSSGRRRVLSKLPVWTSKNPCTSGRCVGDGGPKWT